MQALAPDGHSLAGSFVQLCLVSSAVSPVGRLGGRLCLILGSCLRRIIWFVAPPLACYVSAGGPDGDPCV